MPSMETEVASVVRQLSCTSSPAEINEGVAVICATGAVAGAAAGAVSDAGTGFGLLPQPATEAMATSRTRGVKMR
jgi:hypothetical protein